MFASEMHCVSMNYLIHELIENQIKFRFVSPFSGDYMLMRWQSDPDQVAVVSRIVNEAIDRNAVVLIGGFDVQGDKTAYYVGYLVDETA